jgi:hypothetical protein
MKCKHCGGGADATGLGWPTSDCCPACATKERNNPKRMVDHRAVAQDIVTACNWHNLTQDQAIKCLIYTSTKLLTKELKTDDVTAAEVLSKACLSFRDEIKKVNRMFKDKG